MNQLAVGELVITLHGSETCVAAGEPVITTSIKGPKTGSGVEADGHRLPRGRESIHNQYWKHPD